MLVNKKPAKLASLRVFVLFCTVLDAKMAEKESPETRTNKVINAQNP
jgi:hypothetical protein